VAVKPIAAQLLDQRLVLYRLTDGKVTAARDLCLHRGIPLSMGFLEGDTLVCAYHGFRYDGDGRCVCIPAANGFQADYLSTVSNYPKHLQHLNPPGFKWRRRFDFFLPFTAKLSVFFRKTVGYILKICQLTYRRKCISGPTAVPLRIGRNSPLWD
jgi:nitrite reductase/ring-hydroxylating ferredoxin subunit